MIFKTVRSSAAEGIQFTREVQDGTQASVESKIVNGEGETPIDYRLHDVEGQWKVYDVLIDHDGVTGETRDYVVIDGSRRPVGPVVDIPFHHTHVELKVDVNASEAPVSMEVGDVRLYLRPERHPAIIVVNSQILNGHSEPPIDGLRVRLVASPSGRTVGQATTDESGQAKISLLPGLTYPIEAQIEVSDLHGPVLKARIPSAGVTGLYPGDVRAVRFPRRRLSQ